MEVLRTFALGLDPRHVAATLHVVAEPRRTGDPVRAIEVRLDGEPVGVMSKAISEQIQAGGGGCTRWGCGTVWRRSTGSGMPR